MLVNKVEIRTLPVALTNEELIQVSMRAASIHQAANDKKEELKAHNDREKSEINSMLAENYQLQGYVYHGSMPKPVECKWFISEQYDATLNKHVPMLILRRLDTYEIIQKKSAEMDDLAQPALFPEMDTEREDAVSITSHGFTGEGSAAKSDIEDEPTSEEALAAIRAMNPGVDIPSGAELAARFQQSAISDATISENEIHLVGENTVVIKNISSKTDLVQNDDKEAELAQENDNGVLAVPGEGNEVMEPPAKPKRKKSIIKLMHAK